MCVAEANDRLVTAPCVESDEEVGVSFVPALEDADVMAEITENARPSQGSDTVALTGTGWSGGDDVDFQSKGINHQGHQERPGSRGKDDETTGATMHPSPAGGREPAPV